MRRSWLSSAKEPTAAELYMVAGDAYEEGGKKNIARARKLVLEARELEPGRAVPSKVQDLVPFDEDQVRIDMALALNVEPDDLVIDEEDMFGETAMRVSSGHHNRLEWIVVNDEETAEKIALASVTQDLKEEPENFAPAFIADFVHKDKLKKYVYDFRMEDNYVDELIQYEIANFWELARQHGIDLPEEDEDGNLPDEPDDQIIEDVKEAYAKEASRDPMSFFEEMYGPEATRYAIEAVGIDADRAASFAVRVDGWQHFISRYDGSSDETNAGFVYWRVQ